MKQYFAMYIALAICAAVQLQAAGSNPIRVLVWDEQQAQQKQAYGDKFLGETIAAHLGAQPGITVKTANLESPEQGLDQTALDSTDVLILWAHVRSTALTDAHAERVAAHVREGKL